MCYRRTQRHFWRGEPNHLGDLARRMSGSSDLYRHSRRSPRASINHVTVHDGFTLADLVSYEAKHNEANGEDNRDGSDDNGSINCGVEGPTDDQAINAVRGRVAARAHGEPDAGARRAVAAGRRRGRQQSGRQQQRLLPGQ